MKKFLLLTIISLLFCTKVELNCSSLICQPINGPCPTDEYAWSNPKTIKICAGDYDLSCSPNCCFVIQYYDRYIPNGNGYDYQVSMPNIFFPTDPDCINCATMAELTDYAYWRLMYLNCQRQSFRDSVNWGSGIHNDTLYTPTQCKNTNSQEKCSEYSSCCTTSVGLTIVGGYFYGYQTYPFTDDKGLCPIAPPVNDCHKFCFGFNKDLTESYLTPCNIIPCFPNWEKVCISAILPSCPQCSLNICYRRATNTCQPSTYHDIELDSIVNVDNTCAACSISVADLYNFALQKVLFYEGQSIDYNTPPAPIKCIERYRVLQSKCWHTDYNDGWQLLKWVSCDYVSGCCWSRYKVCRTGWYTVTVELEERCGQDVTCPNFSAPNICYSVCGLDATGQGWRISLPDDDNNIINNIVSSFVAPNPSTDYCEIHVISKEKGIVNLEIFDILGNSVYSKSKYNNQSELVFQLSNDQIPVGVYHYNIQINNRLLKDGSFTILR